ncbi:hypothetical protein FRB95_000912 [Tulasnella sp. JGI-2019a]|nr:hypothetical protein FRB95_000912 [Tulasnella sp. JGI-2019a]
MASRLFLRALQNQPTLGNRVWHSPLAPCLKRNFEASTSRLAERLVIPVPNFGRHHATQPLTSPLSSVLRFTNNLSNAVRNTYWGPRSPSVYGGGSGGRPSGFFNGFRRRLDALPSNAIFYGILAINGGVFLLWYYAQETFKNFRDPQLLRWMYQNFTTGLGNLGQGRVWTLLTACFSHENTGHIVMNLINFALMAGSAIRMLGNTRFLALYLGGGILSSVISLTYNYAIGGFDRRSHGASGAIFAVIAFYATLAPTSTFLLFAIVPMPAWLCVGGMAAYDLYGAFMNPNRRTDGAGHLGGMLAGFLYALRLTRRI